MKKLLLIIILAVVAVINSGFSALAEENAPSEQVVVYYFHTTARCVSCHKIEQYTKEALEKYFFDDIVSGKLDFKLTNVEEPQNKHFVQDYQLYTKSVVLSKIKDGKEIEYKNLEKVWQYLRNKNKFYEYIKDETEKFMEEKGAGI